MSQRICPKCKGTGYVYVDATSNWTPCDTCTIDVLDYRWAPDLTDGTTDTTAFESVAASIMGL